MSGKGSFWVVQFSTGEYGNRYATRKEAQAYADAVNRYSEAKQGERLALWLAQYRQWEQVKLVEA